MTRHNRTWTTAEEDVLQDKWGTVSVGAIAQSLGRTESAVLNKVTRLGLGAFLDSGEYVSWLQFLKAIGYSASSSSYGTISWVEKRGFPLKQKKVKNQSFKVVYLKDWWLWAEQNKNFLDFSKFEKHMLGEEPAWVEGKRQRDKERARTYGRAPWTKTEDDRLKILLGLQRHTYDEMSQLLGRTEGAIARRIADLGLRIKPLRRRTVKWTPAEEEALKTYILDGLDYEEMSQKLGRTTKGIRGKVYLTYGTEKLDNVRRAIK